MAFVKDYTRINWENFTSVATPINATNLNKIDYAVDKIEDYLIVLDTAKAEQSDLLSCLGNYVDEDEEVHQAVEYNTTTGVFTFNFKNGQHITVDLNIEKIPVSFSMDEDGVITMTTSDGETYTADVGSLIKTYSFVDSSTIDFTITTDSSGNKNVTADIINGSITGNKLQPNYLADCVSAKESAASASQSAGSSANNASNSAEDSEAWAIGTRGGVPVTSDDEAYHNNAKYYAESVTPIDELNDLSDVDVSNPLNDEVLTYDSATSKWKNKAAGGNPEASNVNYDNTTSGLQATKVQGAIDETVSKFGGLRIGTDSVSGKPGYWKKEAGTEVFVPFSSGVSEKEVLVANTALSSDGTYTFTDDYAVVAIFGKYNNGGMPYVNLNGERITQDATFAGGSQNKTVSSMTTLLNVKSGDILSSDTYYTFTVVGFK